MPEQAESPPRPAPQPTRQPLSVGRIVHAYCPKKWRGPRAAIVANAWPGSLCANVNVFLDGGNDQLALADFRAAPTGNTLMSATCYDQLDDEQRGMLSGDYWIEWPPRA